MLTFICFSLQNIQNLDNIYRFGKIFMCFKGGGVLTNSAFIFSFGRWILPIIAFYIIFGCGISLIRGNKKTGTIGYLVNSANGDQLPLIGFETAIGRSNACDITLTYTTVSRFHAVLTKRHGKWLLFDTHSKTGTFVNGEKVDDIFLHPTEVKSGDTLVFGNAIFAFYDLEDLQKAEAQKTADNPALFEGDEKFYTGDIILPEHLKTGCTLKNCITGAEVSIDNSASVLIGRSDEADVQIASPAVSRSHALLSRSDEGWVIEDLDSKSGTLLNGEELTEIKPLKDGDIIEICGFTIRFTENA